MTDDASRAAVDSFAVDKGIISSMPAQGEAYRRYDAGGRVVMPGLIDCHTHALYCGNRMQEHQQRLSGASYQSIANAGGGIASTVRAVRAASTDELADQTLARLAALAAEGVTTIEIKSGYGLRCADELKMLAAINRLSEQLPQRIEATFLGAHAIPPGTEKTAYVKEIVEQMLPAVAADGLSRVCDIYIESIAFDCADARAILGRACELGLQCRAHTDQLSNIGGTTLAASFGALSCDHLEHTREQDIAVLASTGTVAVLLPGAYYFLRETTQPPVNLFRKHDVDIAVASDLNPGTSPVASLLTAMHMSTIFFGLSAEEALRGVTRNAARALGLGSCIGTLEPGKFADFTVWDIPGPEFLVYQLGGVRPDDVFIEGRAV